MIKEDRFLISKRPYAVKLFSYAATWRETRWNGEPPPNALKGTWDCRIDAVWFRRKDGVLAACIGNLWDIHRVKPEGVTHFLKTCSTGRYGGNCVGRWNGKSYWGNVDLDLQVEHLEILRPMLANYPAIPPGYDGWYRFS